LDAACLVIDAEPLRMLCKCVDTSDIRIGPTVAFMGLGALFSLSGCAADLSVSAGAGKTEAYREAWSRGWKTIERDLGPYRPREAAVGACDRGSAPTTCLRADRQLAADLEGFDRRIRTSPVPGNYANGNRLLLRAIRMEVTALRLRDAALTARDDRRFQRSQGTFVRASRVFGKAYRAFPAYDRPRPAPSL
jgi:hypothetical protein